MLAPVSDGNGRPDTAKQETASAQPPPRLLHRRQRTLSLRQRPRTQAAQRDEWARRFLLVRASRDARRLLPEGGLPRVTLTVSP